MSSTLHLNLSNKTRALSKADVASSEVHFMVGVHTMVNVYPMSVDCTKYCFMLMQLTMDSNSEIFEKPSYWTRQ